MSTPYWITVLGNIYGFSLCFVITVKLIIIFLCIYGFTSREDTHTDIEDRKTADICFEMVKRLILCSIIPILILIFVPLILYMM